MGNRAVIATSKRKSSVAIYVQWNGGPESILAFLHAAKELGMRDPLKDTQYGMARLTQVIGTFFGGDASLGVTTLGAADVDNWDNGAYLLGPGFTIAKRWGEGSKNDNGAKTLDDLTPPNLAKYEEIKAYIIEAMKPKKEAA
jgi:hypothetical protein